MPDLTPASKQLLRELARRDKGDGVPVRYSGRGRWYLAGSPSSSPLFNTRTFPALYEAGLVTGWNEYDDDGPMRITDAGRTLAAELEKQAREQHAAKAARKANPDGPAALRLLREIAKHKEPAPIHDDGRRRVWRLGAHDGHSASVDTWVALAKAGRIRIDRVSSIGGHRVSITDAGRQLLAPAA